ncbi:hypothetical protein [uncultured Tessaracoccus sp.]|uniref:hypothetical protein n=1 Tax=uncultured Tessaracoccus sp. TaxID=905023 RepID=UPI00261AB530|nr:hypothetical protein [uncultured Tessaracoccus sp.]
MRKASKFGIAMLGTVVMGLSMTGCGSQNGASSGGANTGSDAKSSAPTASAEKPKAEETGSEKEAESVDSIDMMVEKLRKKNYACQGWKQTDDIDGADASGTCNGEDQVMWFAEASKVDAKVKELDDAGTKYVVGENWIVANTVTPTLVRNALGGTAVSGK